MVTGCLSAPSGGDKHLGPGSSSPSSQERVRTIGCQYPDFPQWEFYLSVENIAVQRDATLPWQHFSQEVSDSGFLQQERCLSKKH